MLHHDLNTLKARDLNTEAQRHRERRGVGFVPSMVPSMVPAMVLVVAAGSAYAQVVVTPWAGEPGAERVGAAALAGVYASASTASDAVAVRDLRGVELLRVERAVIEGLVPGYALDGGTDGPRGVAVSDSGRLVFVAVDEVPAAANAGAIVRVETTTGAASVFARLTLSAATPMQHWRGRLYVGVPGPTTAAVVVYSATQNQTTGSVVTTAGLPAGVEVRGMAIDRENATLYVASEVALYRASLAGAGVSFALVGAISDVRGMAWSDHSALPPGAGLFVLRDAAGGSEVWSVPRAQAQGLGAFGPVLVTSAGVAASDVVGTAHGPLLWARADGVQTLASTTDTRLGFEAWLADEFAQVVAFARSLAQRPQVAAGWVIDGDVASGSSFFPATPDAAAWTVLLLLAQHRLTTDGGAQQQIQADVRTILQRYAGTLSGPAPSRTVDGIMRHWIDPATGNAAAGWDPEFATLSTMKISLAAARAAALFADDVEILRANARLGCSVANRDAYVQAGPPFRSYFKGLSGGGPDLGSPTQGFNETILWVEQLARYGGAGAKGAYVAWLDRSRWPTATVLTGRPVSGDVAGQFQSAFITHYSNLLQPDFRASVTWRQQVFNLRDSSAAWTDDRGPRFNTVFSAGTTKPEWNAGGYNADSLSNAPGSVTTFTSLTAFGATGRSVEAVGAYQAYRRGARQTFAGGASILYRRSDVDRGWVPNAAGLPDVALGGLGLAELIRPGLIDSTLARGYGPCPCWANCDESTTAPVLGAADFACFLARYRAGDAYANCDASTVAPVLGAADFSCYLSRYRAGCPQ